MSPYPRAGMTAKETPEEATARRLAYHREKVLRRAGATKQDHGGFFGLLWLLIKLFVVGITFLVLVETVRVANRKYHPDEPAKISAEEAASPLPSVMEGPCPLRSIGGTSSLTKDMGCVFAAYPGSYHVVPAPSFMPTSATLGKRYCAIDGYDIGGEVYKTSTWLGKRKFGILQNEDIEECLASLVQARYEEIKGVDFAEDLRAWRNQPGFVDGSFRDILGRYAQRYRVTVPAGSSQRQRAIDAVAPLIEAARHKAVIWPVTTPLDIEVELYIHPQRAEAGAIGARLCVMTLKQVGGEETTCDEDAMAVWTHRDTTIEGLSPAERREAYDGLANLLVAQASDESVRCRGSRDCEVITGLGNLAMMDARPKSDGQLDRLRSMPSHQLSLRQATYVVHEGRVLGTWWDIREQRLAALRSSRPN